MIGFMGKNVRPQGTWRFLTPDEKLLASDLVRCLYAPSQLGFSDGSPDDVKHMNWSTAASQVPGWIGKSWRELNDSYPMEVIRRVK